MNVAENDGDMQSIFYYLYKRNLSKILFLQHLTWFLSLMFFQHLIVVAGVVLDQQQQILFAFCWCCESGMEK